MIQALQTIADNVQAASQPGWVECLSIVISSISVVVSGIAIWFAVQVPKEIAKDQNKIALFEKRYKVYSEICCCNTFSLGLEFAEKVEDIPILFLSAFEGESLFDETASYENGEIRLHCMATIRAQKLLETLRSSKFLFAEYPWVFRYAERVCTTLMELLAPFSMNDQEFSKRKTKFISIMNDKTYEMIMDRMEKDLQLKCTK